MDNIFYTNGKPYIIAGPCSIENREQLHRTVVPLLDDERIPLIRGGVWKPRSRPGGFEGLGEPALQWVAELKAQHPHMRFCCEVAHPAHVELCMRYHVDALWIGARTSGDPFSMGELCAALRGTDTPVLVKNPTTPDIQLWIGAIERVMEAGIHHVAAVHRGFFTYNSIGYRNNPLWEVPIELKRRMPQLPLFCDPSHIAGQRDPLLQLMQTALDLHFDGLMVEVHHQPDAALTDQQQQIDPQLFLHMLDRLILRSQEELSSEELTLLRQQIDQIDQQILQCLHTRCELSRSIAQVKKRNNTTILQPKRWESVLENKIAVAQHLGLSTAFVKDLYEKIHAESVRIQEEEE